MVLFFLALVGYFVWDMGETHGSTLKSRQIGSVAKQCSDLNGTTILINKDGGLEIDCMPEITASITFPGCATQSATFKKTETEPIFKK